MELDKSAYLITKNKDRLDVFPKMYEFIKTSDNKNLKLKE